MPDSGLVGRSASVRGWATVASLALVAPVAASAQDAAADTVVMPGIEIALRPERNKAGNVAAVLVTFQLTDTVRVAPMLEFRAPIVLNNIPGIADRIRGFRVDDGIGPVLTDEGGRFGRRERVRLQSSLADRAFRFLSGHGALPRDRSARPSSCRSAFRPAHVRWRRERWWCRFPRAAAGCAAVPSAHPLGSTRPSARLRWHFQPRGRGRRSDHGTRGPPIELVHGRAVRPVSRGRKHRRVQRGVAGFIASARPSRRHGVGGQGLQDAQHVLRGHRPYARTDSSCASFRSPPRRGARQGTAHSCCRFPLGLLGARHPAVTTRDCGALSPTR